VKSPSQRPVAPTAPLLEGGADADRMATAEYSSSSVTFLFGIAPEAAPRVHRTLEQRWPLTDIADSFRFTPTAEKIGGTKIAKISKLVRMGPVLEASDAGSNSIGSMSVSPSDWKKTLQNLHNFWLAELHNLSPWQI